MILQTQSGKSGTSETVLKGRIEPIAALGLD